MPVSFMPQFCTLSLAGESRYPIESYSMSLRAGKVLIGRKSQCGVCCTLPLLSGRVLKSGHFTVQPMDELQAKIPDHRLWERSFNITKQNMTSPFPFLKFSCLRKLLFERRIVVSLLGTGYCQCGMWLRQRRSRAGENPGSQGQKNEQTGLCAQTRGRWKVTSPPVETVSSWVSSSPGNICNLTLFNIEFWPMILLSPSHHILASFFLLILGSGWKVLLKTT